MMKKSDSQLQHDVMAELEWEPAVDHADIGVAVTDGVVTLSGYVKNFTEKLAAEKAVRRVAGVRAIAEEINVRLASDSKMADHEIAKRIVDIIAWTISIPADTVRPACSSLSGQSAIILPPTPSRVDHGSPLRDARAGRAARQPASASIAGMSFRPSAPICRRSAGARTAVQSPPRAR